MTTLTDAPFAFRNFHHSVMEEARALRCAGVPDEAILRMATVGSAAAPLRDNQDHHFALRAIATYREE